MAAGVVVLAYLAIWLTHFSTVYGWVNDDYYLYVKGMLTIQNWQQAFLYQYNALQTYFFLISYLPLKTGLSLPSYPLPLLGAETGQFRFLLLYTVFLHAGLVALWAWFATKLTGDRLVALLSLLLFVTSPSLTLWTPQPESRLLGLPFALLGIWLLLRTGAETMTSVRRRLGLVSSWPARCLAWPAASTTPRYISWPRCRRSSGQCGSGHGGDNSTPG